MIRYCKKCSSFYVASNPLDKDPTCNPCRAGGF